MKTERKFFVSCLLGVGSAFVSYELDLSAIFAFGLYFILTAFIITLDEPRH